MRLPGDLSLGAGDGHRAEAENDVEHDPDPEHEEDAPVGQRLAQALRAAPGQNPAGPYPLANRR